MKFITVDMARELSNRFANTPKIKKLMGEVYYAALLGRISVTFNLDLFSAKDIEQVKVFFTGMGYTVSEITGCMIKISW